MTNAFFIEISDVSQAKWNNLINRLFDIKCESYRIFQIFYWNKYLENYNHDLLKLYNYMLLCIYNYMLPYNYKLRFNINVFFVYHAL